MGGKVILFNHRLESKYILPGLDHPVFESQSPVCAFNLIAGQQNFGFRIFVKLSQVKKRRTSIQHPGSGNNYRRLFEDRLSMLVSYLCSMFESPVKKVRVSE